MKKLLKTVMFFSILLLATSCLREEEYPIEPRISFNGYTKVINPADSTAKLKLSMTFTDGDGDIGLYEHEKLPPFDYNLFITLLWMRGGQLEPYQFADSTLTFNGRIPVITPNTRNKAIKGVLNYTFDYQLLYAFFANDTLAFDIYITDRALHRSNTLRTPLIRID